MLEYLGGVRSTLEWDQAIKSRRAMFDVGIRLLQDPDGNPAFEKRILEGKL